MTTPESSPLRLMLTGGLGFALIGAVPGLYGLALPGWTAAYGSAGAGWIIGLHGFGSTIAVLCGLFGLLRLTLRLALSALALGTLALGFGPGWGVLLPAAIVTGFGFGAMSVVVNRRFLTEFGARGPGMVGLVNAIYGIGAIAAPPALLITAGRPGPVYAGLAVLALLALPFVKPGPRRGAASLGLPPLHAGRLSILAFIFASAVIESTLVGYGPSALLAIGMAQANVALLTSGFFATFLAGRLALYWLAPRLQPEHVLAAGFFWVAAALVLVVAGLPALGFVAAGAGVAIKFPAFYVWATQVLGPDERFGAAPLLGALLGGTLGPFALAPLMAAAGAPVLFPVIAGLALAAGLALLASLRRIARISAAALDKRAPA
ncbi:hypothetical protein ACXN5S_19210 [Pseudoroseicyclus sp. H15]